MVPSAIRQNTTMKSYSTVAKRDLWSITAHPSCHKISIFFKFIFGPVIIFCVCLCSFSDVETLVKSSSDRPKNLGWKYRPLEKTLVDAVKCQELWRNWCHGKWLIHPPPYMFLGATCKSSQVKKAVESHDYSFLFPVLVDLDIKMTMFICNLSSDLVGDISSCCYIERYFRVTLHS